MDDNWLNSLYKYWLKGCEFHNKKDYNKAMEYFILANKIFKENVPRYDYYELREEAYKEILNDNIEEGIKKFIWFVEGILADEDYYNLSGELLTIASIFAKIKREDIAKNFLNIGGEWIYNDVVKDAKPEDILKSILTDLFNDEERKEILKKDPSLKNLFEDRVYNFNLDFFDFMMMFFIWAGNWGRFLEVYEEFKYKIKNYQMLEEVVNKIIKRFDKSISDLLAIAHLLKGDYKKCLHYTNLFKEYFNLYEFDEIEKNKINLIVDIADNLKNSIKKEEWLSKLNEIYADILNKPLPKTYKEAHHSNLGEILNYYVLKEFIEKL